MYPATIYAAYKAFEHDDDACVVLTIEEILERGQMSENQTEPLKAILADMVYIGDLSTKVQDDETYWVYDPVNIEPFEIDEEKFAIDADYREHCLKCTQILLKIFTEFNLDGQHDAALIDYVRAVAPTASDECDEILDMVKAVAEMITHAGYLTGSASVKRDEYRAKLKSLCKSVLSENVYDSLKSL